MPKVSAGGSILDIDLLLFDLDGTLVDDRSRYISLAGFRYKALLARAGKEAADEWARLGGWDPETREINMDGPIARAARREDAAVAAASLCVHGHPWHEAKTIADEAYSAADAEQLEKYRTSLFPGAVESLVELMAGGVLLGVATNGQRSVSVDLLRQVGVLELFSVVSGSDEVKEPKPAPDLLLHACRVLSVPPDRAAYVGDQPTDAVASIAAGFGATMIVSGGSTKGATNVGSVSEIRLGK